MSFTLLLAVTAAVAASMGYLAARKHGDDGARSDGSDDEDQEKGEPARDKKSEKKREEEPKMPAPKAAKKPLGSPFATLPLALGDVVQSGTEERWLAGAIVAREGGRVLGALFLAPEGVDHHAVAAFAPPRKDLWWMSPAPLDSPSEPPATIEINGVALPRKGRLPVTLERRGQGAPMVGEDGIWAAYESGSDVAIVIASQGKAHAWSGKKLDEHDYDRLGGGGEEA